MSVQSRSSSGVAVEIQQLTLVAGRRLLLDAAAARFEPGAITLVMGPSGAGKSLLLRVLAGLVQPDGSAIQVSGRLLLDGRELPHSGQGFGQVGVVFQNFALLDELSPADNVHFASAHRRAAALGRAAGRERDLRMLAELGVPLDVRTAHLSGGQRQRLAIARALAYDPQVILYDEPTSGLDPATAAEVARLIRETHVAHGKTSIVVTHDDRSLVPIADHVYLLDPASKRLESIPRESWSRIEELFRPLAGDEPAKTAAHSAGGRLAAALRTAAKRLGDSLVGMSRFAEQAALFPWRLVPRWRSLTWGLRFLLHYMRLVADPSAWLYIAVAGAIAGYVATYFTFRFLPFHSYTEPLIIEDLLRALGFSIYRVFVPVLATLLIAARCGAAVASDVGGKVYGQQIDAMRTFGAPPSRYLATGIYLAFLLGTLILSSIGFYTARLSSLAVFSTTHAEFGPFFWDFHFHNELRMPGQWLYRGTGWLAAKLLVCAAGISVITYDLGSRPKHSTTDVSRGITSTVLWTTLYVLLVHLGFALFEFD
jgi:ABC-type transporter Mla maintaining outer membrane lipid asymmetry ATPase subunit MlaF/ABC-type transporter Mla maintaining outer membrane lipid asymmetry permease subunit MlaE